MTQPVPEGQEGLIPHLICSPCADVIEFYKKAFGAEEVMRLPFGDGGKIAHACLRIGESLLFLMDDAPEFCSEGKSLSPQSLGGSPVVIHRNVEDCDAAIKRAEEAGATVTMPPQDMFWGDRYGTITDPFGHCWSFATHIRDVSLEEIHEGMAHSMPAP